MVRGFARDDLFTVVLEHFMTDTADHADYVLPATTQLEHLDVHTSYGHTYALINEPAIAPLGEAQARTRRSSASWPRAWASTSRASPTTTRRIARAAFGSRVDFDALRARRLGQAAARRRAVRRGRLPDAERAAACIDAPGLGVPDHVPNYESARSHARARARAIPLAMISPPARNFLNSSFVNVKSLRDIEGEPLVEIHADDAAPRGIADGQTVRVFNDRGELPLQGARQRARAARASSTGSASGGASSAPAGTNVNELTHQRLTDIGRAPSFYDCLVEVRPRRRRCRLRGGVKRWRRG